MILGPNQVDSARPARQTDARRLRAPSAGRNAEGAPDPRRMPLFPRPSSLVPGDRLLAETDAPYLAPIPHRGKRNEPAWVSRVLEVLAETRQESVAAVADATSASFAALFSGIDQRF